jgi:hypothetical protein
VHVRLVHFAAAFAMIARRASRDEIRPGMLPTHVTWNDVVNGQRPLAPAAVLAGIIVAAEYFAAR